ncbi:hypothetical protein HYY75_03870 [bacterium]|nr:hypothetical protein [bacterium]
MNILPHRNFQAILVKFRKSSLGQNNKLRRNPCQSDKIFGGLQLKTMAKFPELRVAKGVIFFEKISYFWVISILFSFVFGFWVFSQEAYANPNSEESRNVSQPSQNIETEKLGFNLTQAFFNAFSDAEAFRASHLFDVLGYQPEQVRQLVEVTPRPSSLSVEFSPSNPQSGKFDLIRVSAKEIHYYNLVIHHAILEFPNVEIDPRALSQDKLVFNSLDRVKIETFVAESDILKLFEKFSEAKKLSHLKIKIRKNNTSLSGKVHKGIFLIAFKISGNSVINGTKTVRFQCKKMVLNGLPLPRPAINTIFNQINPVFDARKTWLQLDLLGIFSEEGFVRSVLNLSGPNPGSATPSLAGKG